jgi:hypothetical protein
MKLSPLTNAINPDAMEASNTSEPGLRGCGGSYSGNQSRGGPRIRAATFKFSVHATGHGALRIRGGAPVNVDLSDDLEGTAAEPPSRFNYKGDPPPGSRSGCNCFFTQLPCPAPLPKFVILLVISTLVLQSPKASVPLNSGRVEATEEPRVYGNAGDARLTKQRKIHERLTLGHTVQMTGWRRKHVPRSVPNQSIFQAFLKTKTEHKRLCKHSSRDIPFVELATAI